MTDGESDPILEIYDTQMLPVAMGQGVLETELVEGESYILHVADPSSSVHVSLEMQLDQSGVYTNPVDRFDVSGDGIVSPLDALLVIRRLNSPERNVLWSAIPRPRFTTSMPTWPSRPVDALLVIHRLNNPPDAEAEAAGRAQCAGHRGRLGQRYRLDDSFNGDRITSDPTIAIAVGGVFPVSSVLAGFGQPDTDHRRCTVVRRDVSARSDRHQALLGPLADGEPRAPIAGHGRSGQSFAMVEFAFTLDTSVSRDSGI